MPLSEVAEITETSVRSVQRAQSAARTTTAGPIRYRGRPPRRSPLEARMALLEDIRRSGLDVPIDVYQNAHPELARREVADIVRRLRRLAEVRGFLEETLTWTQPGAVWSIDHTQIRASHGGGTLFVVRDPALRHTWEAAVVPGKGMRRVAKILEALIQRVGHAPLVLKADNAFDAKRIHRLCRQHGIQLLLSPPHYPRFNASVERGIGVLKEHLHPLLALEGSERLPELVDEALARANRHSGLSTAGPEIRESLRSLDREAFNQRCDELRQTIERRLRDEGHAPIIAASVTREAITQALLESELLVIRRRRIHLPVSSRRGAKITCG